MIRRAVGTAFLVAGLAAVPACRERPPTGGPAARLALPPTAAPTGFASASPPAEPRPTCGAACAPGTSCGLTKEGPACVECAPGSVPTCKDDRVVVGCDDRGGLHTLADCAAQKKRCDRGRCVQPECQPGALHCHDGDVYRCGADGASRTLMTACVKVDPDGSLGVDKGLCQEQRGQPACRTTCDLPDHTIVALRDCAACAWDGVPFCATESPERSCMDWICLPDHHFGVGAVAIPCWRDTDGLVVPGSDRPGPCEGASPIGARKIAYETCGGGKPAPATRVEPCRK
jgi:hypothetical protein